MGGMGRERIHNMKHDFKFISKHSPQVKSAYSDLIISDEDPEEKIATITRRLPKWVDKIAREIGAPHAEVEKILTQKWLDPVPEGVDMTGIQYRVEEYTALSGEVGAVGLDTGSKLRYYRHK